MQLLHQPTYERERHTRACVHVCSTTYSITHAHTQATTRRPQIYRSQSIAQHVCVHGDSICHPGVCMRMHLAAAAPSNEAAATTHMCRVVNLTDGAVSFRAHQHVSTRVRIHLLFNFAPTKQNHNTQTRARARRKILHQYLIAHTCLLARHERGPPFSELCWPR